MTTCAPRTASAGEVAARALVAAANSRDRSAVRFQTVRSNPAAATRWAMGRPMAPSPRNATEVIGSG